MNFLRMGYIFATTAWKSIMQHNIHLSDLVVVYLSVPTRANHDHAIILLYKTGPSGASGGYGRP